MSSDRAISVKCRRCPWRGRRVGLWQQGLECCDGEYCQCPNYGYCPRCGGIVSDVKWLQAERENDKVVASFWETHEWVDGPGWGSIQEKEANKNE